MSTKTDLYRHFEKDGTLLYVGISKDAIKRAHVHKRSSDWFVFQNRMTVETYQSREEARQAEKTAIATEHPIYNKDGKTVDAPRKYIDRLPKVIAMKEGTRKDYLESHNKAMKRIGQYALKSIAYSVEDPLTDEVICEGFTVMGGLYRDQVKYNVIKSIGGSEFNPYTSCFVLGGYVRVIRLASIF